MLQPGSTHDRTRNFIWDSNDVIFEPRTIWVALGKPCSGSQISAYLGRMVGEGLLVRLSKGVYELSNKGIGARRKIRSFKLKVS